MTNKIFTTYTEVVKLPEILAKIKEGKIIFTSNYSRDYLHPFGRIFLDNLLKGYPIGTITLALSGDNQFTNLSTEDLTSVSLKFVTHLEGHKFNYCKTQTYETLCLDGKSRLFYLYAGLCLDAVNRYGQTLFYNTISDCFDYLDPNEVDGMLYGFNHVPAVHLMENPTKSKEFSEFKAYFKEMYREGENDSNYKKLVKNWVNTSNLLTNMDVVITYVSGFSSPKTDNSDSLDKSSMVKELAALQNYLNSSN